MVFRGVISYRSFFGTAEWLVILGVVFCFCSYSAYARAGQVSLSWNASTGAAGYQLSYGPSSGNYTSNVDVGNTASHTLTELQAGKYYIAAKAYKYNSGNRRSWSGFSNEAIATISTSRTAPTASFSANRTSGVAPLTVTFTDSSTGNITTWSWDFGDGTTSTAKSAAKTYTSPGRYTVGLTVTGPAGSDTATRTISVGTSAPVAGFTATPLSGTAPLAVTFTDDSTGTVTGYSWSLGDGGTSSAPNPEYTYASAGTYTVSLTATGPEGTNTKTQNDYITVSSSSGGGGGSNAGLVGAYNFEEASGTTVDDGSGKGNTGTISGATRTTQGRFGNALSFDGVDDWVTINDGASLDLTTDMTLEAWVYPTVNMSQWATVILKEQPGGGLYELYANGDQSQPLTSVTVGGQYQVLSGGPWLLANHWTHLAATYDGTTQRLYVNGTQVAQRPQTGPIQVSNRPLRLGGNSVWGEYFQGRIDEVRIYNGALNAAEIRTDMNTPIAPSSPPIRLVGTDTIGPVTDSISQGKAEAFQTYAGSTITGTVTSLSVYIDADSTAAKLVAGLYNDNNGHPSTLLAQATLTSPTAGDWNEVPLPATPINADSTYWIAILSPSGVLQFRDQVYGGRPSETSAQSTLTNLPNTWTTGTVVNEGRLSAYGAGTSRGI
ncbi:MAG: LamG-like jellyroll fold domain-containing protein [Gammaproteobacteria bacterium]